MARIAFLTAHKTELNAIWPMTSLLEMVKICGLASPTC